MFRGFGDIAQINRMEMLEKAGLTPIINAFPGLSLADKLASGYAQAKAVLLKYTSTLRYDAGAAQDLFNQIETWQATHQALIADMMKRPASDTLPEQVALAFSPPKAQAFIVAGFSEAARGLGPWLGGIIGQKVATDPRVTDSFAKSDASGRLAIFASIVKMERDGDLNRIFHPAAGGVQGLGALPVIAWIVIGIVSALAVILTYVYMSRQSDQNNKLMSDLCHEAEKQGNTAQVQACIQATADLQAGLWGGLGQGLKTAAMYAAIGGAVYVAAIYVVPKLMKKGQAG